MNDTIDAATWERLTSLAVEAMKRAYCPYSGYPVGAAGLTTDGRWVSGSNVENASYGCGLCAECSMVSELVATGGGRLAAVACVNGNGESIVPCGRCRQLIFEHGGNDCVVLMPTGPMPMSEVLPGAFGPADLDEVASAASRHD
ncbi:cytidine deaminase [Actinomyces culturomici]|uniref:cytidine deaminase n=1 Tax=Actinomyces culturomici TaxID=1926276 RepID=UPI002286ED05|nr:cytidine deaminase [Actinomyces culturomici]